jgi:hypothetical protein
LKKYFLWDFLFFVLILLCYLLTTNQNFSFDGITNALAAESNEPIRWFHPNHPLYPFLGVVGFRIQRFLGYEGFAIYSLSNLNSVLSAAGLTLVLRTMRSLVGSALALATVLMLGTSYGIWAYAVDARAVGASIFFSCLIYSFLFRRTDAQPLSPWSLRGLGLLSALYILCHGIAVLHVPAVAWWCVRKSTWKSVASNYLAPILILGSLSMGLIYWTLILPVSQTSFLNWILGYAGHTNISFWVESVGALFKGQWAGWKHFFYVPWFNSPSDHMMETLVGAGALLFVILCLRPYFKDMKNNFLSSILFVWGVSVGVFLTFWSPGQEGFRIHMVVPIMLGLVLSNREFKPAKWAVGFFAVVIFTLNLNGSIGMAASIKNNLGYQMTGHLAAQLKPGDLFMSAQSGFIPNFEVLRPYFFPHVRGGTFEGRMLESPEKSLSSLAVRFQTLKSEGSRIYFGADMLDRSVQEKIAKQANLSFDAVDKFIKNYSYQPAFTLEGNRVVYEVVHH